MDRALLRKPAATNTAKDAVHIAKMMPALNTEQLFDGFREIRLFHSGKEYRLRLTRNDKLILTK